MNKRKIIAMLIVAVMVVSMMSPLTALASQTGTGTGIIVGVNTTILNVTMPTGLNFNFYLDPYGFLAIPVGGTMTSLEMEEHKNKIVFPANFAPTIVNASSIPVDVGIAVDITGDGSVVEQDDGFSGTDTSLWITGFHATAGNNAMTATATTETSIVATTTSAERSQFTADSNPDYMQLWLGAASYLGENKNTVEPGEDGFDPGLYSFDLHDTTPTKQAAQFIMEGALNDTDWDSFIVGDDMVGMSVTYAFQASTATSSSLASVSSIAFAFVDNVSGAMSYDGINTAASIGPGAIPALVANTWLQVPFSFGGYTITSVTNNGSNLPTSGTGHRYRTYAGGLEFYFTNTTAKAIVVTLSNGESYSFTFTAP